MDLFTDAEDWIGGYPNQFVQHVELCQAMKHLQLVPIAGPEIISGMTTLLAGPSEYYVLPDRELLQGPFGRSKRGCWYSPLPIEWSAGQASPVRMYEDEACLGTPYGSTHLDTTDFCTEKGRYEHIEGGLLFTTSDGSDPNENGRKYSITIPKDSK
eukprot:TRINITY_DN6751_c0_g1_i2.p1 TRINITY_DN6751_c0_g1~~TRINITY_DN6751_c0_g1_i2.p1  ORF type:complete len:156 (-),score=17.74 TRINITY_DN6751_c0_g1_i2:99-566(-)